MADCLALAGGAVGRVSSEALIFLAGGSAGAELRGGKSCFSGFSTFENRDGFGVRVPVAVGEGAVPWFERRPLDGLLAWNFLSPLPDATFWGCVFTRRAAAGGFWSAFVDALGTLARWTRFRFESDAGLDVGDPADTIDANLATIGLRWLYSITVATAIPSSRISRISVLRRRLLRCNLRICLDALDPGSERCV